LLAISRPARFTAWGNALGAGTTTNRSDTGYEVLTGVRSVAAGIDFTCAVVGLGEIRCWGSNDYGQLGDGTKDAKTTPTAAPSFCALSGFLLTLTPAVFERLVRREREDARNANGSPTRKWAAAGRTSPCCRLLNSF